MKPELDVVAAVIFNVENELLLAQKAENAKTLAGLWEFPGGKIQAGENPQQALKREILEELNLSIQVQEHLITHTHEYDHAIINLQAYLCFSETNEAELREHQKVFWLTKEKAQDIPLVPADIPILKQLLKTNRHSKSL